MLLEDQINVNDGSISAGNIDPGILNNSDTIDFLDISAGFVLDQENAWFGITFNYSIF